MRFVKWMHVSSSDPAPCRIDHSPQWGWPVGRIWRRVTPALLLLLAGGGCSVNGLGIVAGRVVQGDGALTFTTYAPGLHVRTRSADRGLSVGFTRRLCLADAAGYLPAPGWHLFRLPPVPDRCYAHDAATLGLELRATPVEASFALGLRQTTTLALFHASEPQDYALHYDAADTGSAFLRVAAPGELR